MDTKIAGAKVVPYSSIVGGGVMLLNAAGACVGQLAIVGVGEKERSEEIAQRVAGAINEVPEASLTPYEKLRIAALNAMGEEVDGYFTFGRAVAEAIGVPKDVGLAILRQLRDEGLVVLSTVFDEDEFRPAGSGYALTAKGVAARVAATATQEEGET